MKVTFKCWVTHSLLLSLLHVSQQPWPLASITALSTQGVLRPERSDGSVKEPRLVSRGSSCELCLFPSRFAQNSQWNLFEQHFSKAHQLVKRTNASLFGSHGFVRFLECHVLMLQKMPEDVFMHTLPETRSQALKVPVSLLSFP